MSTTQRLSPVLLLLFLQLQLPAGVRTFHVVIANILRGPLLELQPRLTAYCKPGARLALSGILTEQVSVAKCKLLAGQQNWASSYLAPWSTRGKSSEYLVTGSAAILYCGCKLRLIGLPNQGCRQTCAVMACLVQTPDTHMLIHPAMCRHVCCMAASHGSTAAVTNHAMNNTSKCHHCTVCGESILSRDVLRLIVQATLLADANL